MADFELQKEVGISEKKQVEEFKKIIKKSTNVWNRWVSRIKKKSSRIWGVTGSGNITVKTNVRVSGRNKNKKFEKCLRWKSFMNNKLVADCE